MLKRLDIINDMLRATGTSRLTAEDTQHPAYITANDTLQRVSMSVQAMGLWFNTTYPELRPNLEGEIIVPADSLHCDPTDVNKRYAVRKRRVFDLTNRTFVFTASETFKVVTGLDIEDMPYQARDYVRAKAKYDYYLDEDGGNPKLDQYKGERDQAWAMLYREHLKSRDNNWYESTASRRLAKGNGYGHGGVRHVTGRQE